MRETVNQYEPLTNMASKRHSRMDLIVHHLWIFMGFCHMTPILTPSCWAQQGEFAERLLSDPGEKGAAKNRVPELGIPNKREST